jgi:hypothetical protein
MYIYSMRFKWIIIFVAGFVLSSQLAVAQLQQKDDPFLICGEEGSQRTVEVTAGGDNKFLVVWNDLRDASEPPPPIYFDIYGILVSQDISTITEEILISLEYRAIGVYNKPCVVYNEAQNEYFVCWTDNNLLFGQRVSETGTLIGNNFVIGPCDEGMITVTYNSTDGNYLVTYDSGGYLKGLILDHSGGIFVQPFTIRAGAHHQQVAYNSVSNEFMVAYYTSVTGYKIQARRVSNSGELMGDEINVAADEGLRYSPTIAYNSKRNEYLIAWYDERNYEEYVSEIWARRYTGDGSAVANDYCIVGGEWNLLQPAHLAYNSNRGEYLISWSRQYEFWYIRFEILGRRLNNIGEPFGNVLHFDMGTDHHQNTPRVAFNAYDNRYLVVWEQGGSLSDDGLNIYGEFIWGRKYLKHFVNGPQSNDDGSCDFSLVQNYPNPVYNTTMIQYQLPRFSYVTLKILDINGAVVRTLVNEAMQTGYHCIVWDSKDDMGENVANGIYFYQLQAGEIVTTKKMTVIR